MRGKELESGRELAEAKADYTFGGAASHHYIRKGTPVDFGACRGYLTQPRTSSVARDVSEWSRSDIVETDGFLPKSGTPAARFPRIV